MPDEPLKPYPSRPGARMVSRRIGDIVRDPVTGLEEEIVDSETIIFIARLGEMHAVPEMLDRIIAEAERRQERAVLPFRKVDRNA